MAQRQFLRDRINESDELATSFWHHVGLSTISIWDRIKLAVVTAAIVAGDDESTGDTAIVDAAVATVTGNDSFIVDPLFGLELERLVAQHRKTPDPDGSVVELQLGALVSTLLQPLLSAQGVAPNKLDQQSRRAAEDCARDISARAAVAKLFYDAGTKTS